jgi:hypothetical protein
MALRKCLTQLITYSKNIGFCICTYEYIDIQKYLTGRAYERVSATRRTVLPKRKEIDMKQEWQATITTRRNGPRARLAAYLSEQPLQIQTCREWGRTPSWRGGDKAKESEENVVTEISAQCDAATVTNRHGLYDLFIIYLTFKYEDCVSDGE